MPVQCTIEEVSVVSNPLEMCVGEISSYCPVLSLPHSDKLRKDPCDSGIFLIVLFYPQFGVPPLTNVCGKEFMDRYGPTAHLEYLRILILSPTHVWVLKYAKISTEFCFCLGRLVSLYHVLGDKSGDELLFSSQRSSL